jgi:DNA-binding response OmpR family regulator
MIRKKPEHIDTPIIFLASEGTVDYLSVAVNLGACDFMVKPIDDALLRSRIAEHLKGYLIRRRMRSM